MGGRLSEQQKKDLKFKIQIGTLVFIFLLPVLILGPLWGSVHKHVEKNKAKEWAGKWMYRVGRVYEATWRWEKAHEVYIQTYILYCGDEEEQDWELFSEATKGLNHEYYLQWVVDERYLNQDKDRPKAIRNEKAPVALAMHRLGKHYSERKRYDRSDPMYHCLELFWPAGSEGQKIGAEGVKRSKIRSY